MSVRHSTRRPSSTTRRERPIAIAAVLGLLALVMSFLPGAAASAAPADDGNPDLPQKCGLDMTIIIDRSGSIGNYNDDVADAANALIDGVSNTGSKVQVISFSSRATAVTLAGGVGSSSNISDLTLLPAENVQLTQYTSSGGTNWDDALEMARRQPAVTPLTVVLTDGNPTYHNSGNGVNGHGNSLGGNGGSTSTADVNKAVQEADLLKAAGSHILAVGIGSNLNTANLEAISGEERLTATNGVSFSEADWTTVGFTQLKALLEDFTKELCAPSLNITKTEIPLEGAERPGDGWTFDLELESAPQEWENPAQQAGLTTASQVTDEGKASFKWEQGATQTMGAEVGEQPREGWVFSSATCQRRNYDSGAVSQLTLAPQMAQDGSVSWVIPGGLGPADSVNCNVRNRQVAPARIDVRKVTAPAAMPGEFDFSLDGNGESRTLEDLNHGDTESFGNVAPGTYAVGEATTPNFTQTSAACDNIDTPAGESLDPSTLTVAEGEHWLCTFTNTADDGSITVRKVAQGADGTFGFSSDFNGSFELATSGGSASTAAVPVTPGRYSVSEATPAPWTQVSAVCDDGSPVGDIEVGPGEDVTCTFTNLAPDPSIEVTKTAGTASVDEPGATVTFTVGITNTSVEPVTIDSVTDTVDGGSPFDVDALAATTCDDLIGTTLAAGASTSCTFDYEVQGDAGDVVDDVIEVTGHDGDDNTVSDSDDATVTVNDVDPRVQVDKVAGATSVAEPGADVEYTVTVTNPGAEAVTVDSLTDSIENGPAVDITTTGAVVKATTCGQVLGATIAPGGSNQCSFTVEVSGDGGTSVTDVVEVEASDNDGNDVSDTDDARVDITDVVPTVALTKSAASTSVPEPGANVTFSFVIENTAAEAVTITSLTDTVFGDITAECDLVGDTLAPSDGQPGTGPDSARCEVTRGLLGNAGDQHHNIATVVVADDDGNSASAQDDATVAFTDVLPAISVDKDASRGSVPEPGATVDFTATMTNTGVEPVTITGVTDSIGGSAPFDVTSVSGPVLDTDCGAAVGTVVDPGQSYDCTFTVLVSGNAGATVTDVVSFTATDDEGNEATDDDDESVDVDDVLPSIVVTKDASVSEVDEPGADVEFTFSVTNTSVEDVTVTSVVDSVFGDITDECSLRGAVLAPGGTTDCTITRFIAGNAGDVHENTVVVTATDDEQNATTDDDDESVDIDDSTPGLEVTKDASVSEVDEPGADVDFTFSVTNTSVEDLTVTSVVDSVFGDITDECSLRGAVLAPGGTTDCTITRFVGGNAGDVHENTVVVTGTDDEGNEATDDDDESVDVDDVLPSIVVTKDASVSEVDEPGADVEFTFSVTNTSVEDVTVTSVVDSVFGDITDECSLRGAVLAPGGTTDCTITRFVGGNAGDVHENTVVVTATDDEQNPATGTDDEDVDVLDVLPVIEVTKTDGEASVDAPGGTVTYTVDVANIGVEPVTLDSLTDIVDGGDPIDVSIVAEPISATTCELGVQIAPGDTYSCTFDIEVLGDGSSGVFDVVSATVSDDEENPAEDSDDEQTPVDPVADLGITKTADSQEVNSGDQVSYTLTVDNDGPSTATEVTVTDELPEGLALVSVDGDEGEEWDCDASTDEVVSCRLLALAAGESATLTVVAAVDSDPGTIRNTVVVASETPDPDDTNNTDDEDVDVVAEPVQTTTTTPVTVESETAVPPASPNTSGGSASSTPLAFTGGSALLLSLGGLVVLLVGAALVVLQRRRSIAS